MRSRIKPILAGLITLAMVIFGQVCALKAMVVPFETGDPVAADVSTADHDEATCTPESCGGESGSENEGGCPSGATTCCSTWGPPTNRLALSPPASSSLALSDLWLVVADAHSVDEGAAEVALFELARSPGNPDALLVSSLSRRGPPALS